MINKDDILESYLQDTAKANLLLKSANSSLKILRPRIMEILESEEVIVEEIMRLEVDSHDPSLLHVHYWQYSPGFYGEVAAYTSVYTIKKYLLTEIG